MGLIISKIKKESGSPAADIQSELCQAARAGNCAELARLIQAGADVNACDRWDAFPLYHACLTGQLEAAQMLLDAGADYSESTSEGKRCYLSALNLGIRRLLREYEADPRAGLPATLLPVFLACNQAGDDSAPPTDAAGAELSPDITLYVEGRAIQAHRVILAARSPYFRRKLATSWRNHKALRVTFDSYSPSFEATYGLVRYFYSDRLEVAMEHIEDLARVCETCECDDLLETIDRLFPRKRRGDGARHLDRGCPQKRFVLQRRFAPDRLSSALRRILHDCLANSRKEDRRNNNTPLRTRGISSEYDDLADVSIKVGDRVFRCHQMILALRSEYFRTRLSRRTDFRQHHYDVIEEHDVSAEAFEKMLEYIYTDELQDLGDDPLTQAEELLDVASRYLLFQLKPVVAKLLLPHLVLYRVSPAQLCRWLTLSDMYDVYEVREHCLDIMACNFETFAEVREFRPLLLASRKSAPADNLANNLQRRWLRIAAAGLSER